MMRKSLLSLTLIALLLIAGCTQMQEATSNQTIIGSEEEAIDTLINVSSGVGDIESALDDIDSLLG